MKTVPLISFVVLHLFCFISAIGQDTNQKPILLKTVDENIEDVVESLYGVQEQLRFALKNGEEMLAIRVCSAKPLSISLSIARDRPFSVASRLSFSGVPLEKIVYLRNERHCSPSQLDKHTEYWLIPSDSEFPNFEEARLAKNLSQTLWIDSGNRIMTSRLGGTNALEKVDSDSFKGLLSNLVQFLSEKRLSLVSIQYCSNKDNSKSKDVTLKIIARKLSEAGISESRIFWNRTKTYGCSEFPDIATIMEK